MRGDARGQHAAKRLPLHRLQLRTHQERRCALGEGQQLAGMAHDVDVGQVLERPRQIGPHLLGCGEDEAGEPTPQRLACSFLGQQRRGAHKAVGVADPTVADLHPVQHAVAVKWVEVGPERAEPRIRAVADVGAVQLGRQLAGHGQIANVTLLDHRREKSREVWIGGRSNDLVDAHIGIIAPVNTRRQGLMRALSG